MNENSRRGVNFAELLTLLFVGLKLAGVIDWSWWWVLSPVWITVLFALAVIAGCGIVMAVMTRREK